MLIQAFISPWKLQDIVGKPSSSGFWRDNSLSKFAVSHRLSRRDSIASLAFLEMVWDKKVGDVLQLSIVRASQNDPIHVNMVVDEVAVEKFNRWPRNYMHGSGLDIKGTVRNNLEAGVIELAMSKVKIIQAHKNPLNVIMVWISSSSY
ncbi:hypothetical protein OROGR_012468 [Orobanche gracilis]